mgnify:FL=1
MSIFIRALLLSAATSLVACGGGGKSDSKPAPVSSAVSNTVSSAAVSSSITSVASSMSLASSSAAISSMQSSSDAAQSSSQAAIAVKVDGAISAFDETGAPALLNEELVAIEVHLLDANDQPIQMLSPDAVGYQGEQDLRFNADLHGSNAGSVAVTVSYPGYTSYSRKLKAEEAINVNAKLQLVPVQTVVVNQKTSISGVAVEGFNINVSADNDSQQSDSMQIQIPESLLPEGTSALDVAVRTFDPNDENDKEFFPGAYADSDGNDLVSVAFNFAEINTDTGMSLQKAMRKARQEKIAKAGGAHKVADDEPVIINRQIPAASCRLLESLGDSDALTTGFQVPVYTYNSDSGLWDLLGHGTIYTEAGEKISETQQEFNCDTTKFYLEIFVTNEIFLSDWWNLDYPLVFTQPVDTCARIKINNPEGEVLAGVGGFVWDDTGDVDFAVTSFTTNAEGVADIKVEQTGVETQATVYIYDIKTFTFLKKAIALSSDCTAPAVQVIELDRPAMCTVDGSLAFKNGAPVARELVYAFSLTTSSPTGFAFANSDNDGKYRLTVACKDEYKFAPLTFILPGQSNINSWVSINVDGVVQAAEQSDDGKTMLMKPIQLDYTKPFVTGYYSYETNQAEVEFISHYAAFPMSYSVTVKSEDGATSYGTFTGVVTANDEVISSNVGEIQLAIDLPEQPEGYEYQIKLDITDALNNTWLDVPAYISIGSEDDFSPQE